MDWIPVQYRCAVAIGIVCAEPRPDLKDYLDRLLIGAERCGVSAQLFVTPGFCAEAGVQLRQLTARGHGVDVAIPAGVSLSDVAVADVIPGLCMARSCMAETTGGVRAYAMSRLGIQKREDLQEALLGADFRYISSDYSTKLPEKPGSPGFADKNAAMLIKHSQPRECPRGLLEIPAAGYSAYDFLVAQGRGVDAWLDHVRQCIDFAHDLGKLLYAPHLQLEALAIGDPEALTIPAIAAHGASKKLGPVAVCTLADVHGWVEAAGR